MKALSGSYSFISTEHISVSMVLLIAESLHLPAQFHWNDTLEMLWISTELGSLLTMKVYDDHEPHRSYNAVGRFLIGRDLHAEIMAKLDGNPLPVNYLPDDVVQAILDKFETGVIRALA